MNKDKFRQIVMETITEILDGLKGEISPMVLFAVSTTFALLAGKLTSKLYPDDDTEIEIER